MSLAANVLSELENGQWSLATIAPSFRRRLSTEMRSDAEDKSLLELCMGFYGKVHIERICVTSSKKEIDFIKLSPEAKNLIQEAFAADYVGSRLIPFEPEVSKKLQAALAMVEKTDSNIAVLVNDLISSFGRVKSVNFRSASHPRLFGMILLGDGVDQLSEDQLAVSIVHELAHQELFLINLLDRLVNQAFDYNEVHAPFQGTKRPPIGRLHSMWALYRMVQFQKRQGEVNKKYCELLQKNLEAFESQELTPFGIRLVEIVRKRVS